MHNNKQANNFATKYLYAQIVYVYSTYMIISMYKDMHSIALLYNANNLEQINSP